MAKHLWFIALVLLTAVFASKVAEEDALKIMRGFADGLDIDSEITPDGYVEGDDMADVITLISAENRKLALKGLKKLGGTLMRVPDIIANRGGNEGADDLYINKILALATDLTKVDVYAPKDNNNVTIRGVSIIELINKATNALNAKEFEKAGMALGEALANVFTATEKPVSEEVTAEAQEKAEAVGWESGEVPEFISKYESIDEAKSKIMGVPDEEHTEAVAEARRRRRLGIEPPAIYARQKYPDSFDPRTKWPKCMHAVRNQGECGSCWAFAGTGALADRFCIASKESINKVLSPQYMLECDKENAACNGGSHYYEYLHIQKNGVYQESCTPYIAGSTLKVNSCPSKCKDGSAPNKLYTSETLMLQNENDIKYQLMNFGPLATSFTVYQDFMTYKKGIYSHVSGGKSGGHAVKLMGWGVEKKVKYWLLQNSWGAGWGEDGYFRIKVGDSDINVRCSGATPDLKRSITKNKNGADIPSENNGGNTGGAEFNKGGKKAPEPEPEYEEEEDWGYGEDEGSQESGEEENSDWGYEEEDWGWRRNSNTKTSVRKNSQKKAPIRRRRSSPSMATIVKRAAERHHLRRP